MLSTKTDLSHFLSILIFKCVLDNFFLITKWVRTMQNFFWAIILPFVGNFESSYFLWGLQLPPQKKWAKPSSIFGSPPENSIIVSPSTPLYQQYPLPQLKTFNLQSAKLWYGMIWYGMSLPVITPTNMDSSFSLNFFIFSIFVSSFGCPISWSFIHCCGQ